MALAQSILDIFAGRSANTTERQQFGNNLTARLAYDIAASTTTFNIEVVTGAWPTLLDEGEWFYITVSDPIDGRFEVMKVTSVTGDAFLTVDRAQEQTASQAWEAARVEVSARLTAMSLTRMARRDENTFWSKVQKFTLGLVAYDDARFVDRLSFGGDDVTPRLALTKDGATGVAATAAGALKLASPELDINTIGWPANPGLVEGQVLYVDPDTHGITGHPPEWFLGAYTSPPAVVPGGDPLRPGMLYFNLSSLRPKVWTGLSWRDFLSPGPGWLAELVYVPGSPQTTFPLGTADANGESYTMDPATPETVTVHVNGLLKKQDVGFGGDYTVDANANEIVFASTVATSAVVQISLAISPERLSSTGVNTVSLSDITPDGTTKIFTMTRADTMASVIASEPQELEVFVDGVRQRPTVDYTVLDDALIFTVAPRADSIVWGAYFAPFGVDGTPGPAGPGWIAGSGAPDDGTDGSNGDFYFDEATGDVYGPKTGGMWDVAVANLTGPSGVGSAWFTGTGVPSGGLGEDGDFYLDDATGDVYGPKASGAWGSASSNLQGADGTNGAPVAAINSEAGTTYTPALGDEADLIEFTSSSPVLVTLPQDSDVAFAVNTVIYFCQAGTGTVTLSAGSGATVLLPTELTSELREQQSVASAIKVAANTWRLLGDLAPIAGASGSGGVADVIQTASTSFQPTASEAGVLVEFTSGSAVTVTLPEDSAEAINVNTAIYFCQAGAGTVTFQADAGSTVLVATDLDLEIRAQHGIATAVKTAADTWRLFGDLGAT